jgi:hypothetical protein
LLQLAQQAETVCVFPTCFHLELIRGDLVYMIRKKEETVLDTGDPLDKKRDRLRQINLNVGGLPGSQLLQKSHVVYVLKDFVLNLTSNTHPVIALLMFSSDWSPLNR